MSFVVTPDGERFLLDVLLEEASHAPITAVMNRPRDLKR